MNLTSLDRQLQEARGGSEDPAIDDATWRCIATSIAKEVLSLDENATNQLRLQMPVPPERYREELEALHSWQARANQAVNDPIVVRALVMTELYVSFVWLRDSLIKPAAAAVGHGVLSEIHSFLSAGSIRRLRNSIAHGRWTYKADFSGLDCWDGNPLRYFSISQTDYIKWQTLSRGASIAIVLALTEDKR